jgi:hypothetical protein
MPHVLLRARGVVLAAPETGGSPIDAEGAQRRIHAMHTAIDEVMAGQEALF